MTIQTRQHLLLVHWDTRIAKTLTRSLEDAFVVHHVPDMNDAAKVMGDAHFDCVLLPWHDTMLDTFPETLGTDPSSSATPLVLLLETPEPHSELPRFASDVACLTSHKSVLRNRLLRIASAARTRSSVTSPEGMGQLLSRISEAAPLQVKGLELDHAFRPSGPLRRDLFDCFHIREDTIRLVLMDLAGPAGRAAMMASLIYSVFRTTKSEFRSLRDTVVLANNQLMEILEPGEESATVFALDFSLPDGEIEYVNAGHTSGLLVKEHKQVERLSATGPVLGLVNHVYLSRKINIGTQFDLVLATNGFHTWDSKPGRRFGQERLFEVVEHLFEQDTFSCRTLMDTVESMADSGERFKDDATALHVSWRLPEPESALLLDPGLQKLLIVDDLPSTLKILVDAFRDSYEILIATNGEDALRLARDTRPDLILLDIVLPRMNGYEVCHLLKSDDKTRDIPVIFMTAMNEEEDEIKGLQMGAVDYITKPFSLPVVKSRVANHMELKRKTDRLDSLASLDGLTSIPNRRGFDDRMNKEWQSAVRSGKPLSMIMVDIDHFKRINDTYGHAAGDDVLRQLARVLVDCLKRSTDYLARFGGEEFAIILPYTDEQGAALVAGGILDAVCNTRFRQAGEILEENITVSLGVAGLIPTSYDSPRLLLEQADACLYDAKTQGRNRVVCKGP